VLNVPQTVLNVPQTVLNVPQTMLSRQDGKICISEVLETININAPIKDEMPEPCCCTDLTSCQVVLT
jgi:hypothetical protein